MQRKTATHNVIAFDSNGNSIHLGWAKRAVDKNGFDFLHIDLKRDLTPGTRRLQVHLTKAEKDVALEYLTAPAAA